MAEFELGVYASPFAPESVTKRVRDILRHSPEGPTFYLTAPPNYQYRPIPRRVVVVGGEGSIRTVIQMMYDREEIKPVGLLPGGSQNVLYNALRKLGLESDAKTFLEKTLDDYPESQRLRPGMINDRVFVNHVGLGRLEHHLGRFNARLRFLPNGYRTVVATLLSLAAASLHPGKDFLNLYTITPRVGSVLAFPGQRLLSNELTHAWMRRGWIRQLRGFRFHDATLGNYAWFDGDTRFYPQREVLIARAPYGIPVVALT